MAVMEPATATWPTLPLEEWRETQETLHLWTQIVGKIKLALTPFLNEWWNVAFAITPRGLTTGPIPVGDRVFSLDFDFVDHALFLRVSDGSSKVLGLIPRTVANFYAELLIAMRALGIEVAINPMPVEIPNPIRFDVDHEHTSYDPEPVERWWQIMVQTEKILQRYRSPFVGKSSPIHFFWGSFDLSATRFSGRRAEPLAAWPRFMQLAEQQENVACGFWPGNSTASGVAFGEPAFYAYTYPSPAGNDQARIRPDAAGYDPTLGEYVLRYEHARLASDPDATILAFFQSCYEAAAMLAGWDRDALEQRVADER